MPHADLIIFLDFPLAECKEWAMKRQEEFRGQVRPDLPDGCFMDDKDQTLLDLLDVVDREFLPQIREWASSETYAHKFMWLRRREELVDVGQADPSAFR